MGTELNRADDRSVLRAHGFHSLQVKDIVQETDDTRSYVLEIPEDLAETFRYRAGQFCTFRVRIEDGEHLRSYSMSTAPETDADLAVTVKRVPGGLISNWFLDKVGAGDILEVTRPAGVFCLGEGSGPVVAFCGGSGVTPVMSITKSALTTTSRPVKILYANRGPQSVIFEDSFRCLQSRYPDRLEIHNHFDCDSGFVDRNTVRQHADIGLNGDFYICGPEPFMDLVELTLTSNGVSPDHIFIERFDVGGAPAEEAGAAGAVPESDEDVPEEVTVVIKGKKNVVPYRRGDTLLETARRGGLNPPFSCEAGDCATCMAMLRQGRATMRTNHALTAEEVQEGWILTCQALPVGRDVKVEYEAF